MRAFFGAAAVAVAGVGWLSAGCGNEATGRAAEPKHSSSIRVVGPIGRGADQYWLFRPGGPPKAVVVWMHGLATSELTPVNHRPWLLHLARQGDAVVYPRYEVSPGAFGAIRHAAAAVGAAKRRLGNPRVPTVVIGYSRGGRLAAEYAAVAPAFGTAPAAVLSIFPGQANPRAEERIDLRSLDRKTRIVILVGDHDNREGARELLRRLQAAAFPASRVRAILVRSSAGFVADHLSVFRTSAPARRAFWARADGLVKEAAGLAS